jgi:hypothetical protein
MFAFASASRLSRQTFGALFAISSRSAAAQFVVRMSDQ